MSENKHHILYCQVKPSVKKIPNMYHTIGKNIANDTEQACKHCVNTQGLSFSWIWGPKFLYWQSLKKLQVPPVSKISWWHIVLQRKISLPSLFPIPINKIWWIFLWVSPSQGISHCTFIQQNQKVCQEILLFLLSELVYLAQNYINLTKHYILPHGH